MGFNIRQVWALLFFFGVTIVLYHDGYGSQFVDDFFTCLLDFKLQGWAGFKDSFGFPSLYYGHNFFVIGFYDLFGFSKIAWFLLFTGMHSLNVFLGFIFCKQLLKNNNIRHAALISFFGSLLFLTAPYQTENVVWGATLHYALAFFYLWTCLLLYARHLESGKLWQLIVFHLLFAVALVTLELSLVFPGVFVLVFALLWFPSFEIARVKQAILKIAAPQAAIIVWYFLTNKFLKGHYIGHYGSETHLANLTIERFATTFLSYVMKLVCYTHQMPYDKRGDIYGFIFDSPFLSVTTLMLLVAMGLIALLLAKRKAALIVGLLLASFTLLIPVLNMYFAYLLRTENGRLSYFASFFVCIAVVLLLSYTGKRAMSALCLLLVGLNIYFLIPAVKEWKGAAEVQELAVNSFKWENADRVFFLNQPCYYRSIYVFRNKERFHRALFMMRDINAEAKIREVAWTPVNSSSDSVLVEKSDNNTARVALSSWGRWFWYNSHGAIDYENDYCRVDFDEYLHSYTVMFKNLTSSDAVIYFTPTGWKRIRFE